MTTASDDSGFIYLLQQPDGWYKIGKTANLEQRFRAWRWEEGRNGPLVLLCLIVVDKQTQAERMFQRIFRDVRTTQRHRGLGPCHELFRLSDTDLHRFMRWADIIGKKVVYTNLVLNDKDWLRQLRAVINGI